MRGLNKVTLIGNLGGLPDYQTRESTIAVAEFSLAAIESFKDKNGQSHSSTERAAVGVAHHCTLHPDEVHW